MDRFRFPRRLPELAGAGSRYLSGNLEYNSSPQKIKYYISEMYLSSPDAMQPGSRPWVTWVGLGWVTTQQARVCVAATASQLLSAFPASRHHAKSNPATSVSMFTGLVRVSLARHPHPPAL